MSQPMQDPNWIDFYDKAWEARGKLFEEWMADGAHTPFQLIERLRSFETKYYIRMGENGAMEYELYPRDSRMSYLPTGFPAAMPHSFNEEDVFLPTYQRPIDFVIDYLDTLNVSAIVELGAGYGQNLFELSARRKVNVPLYAGEFTEAGRTLAHRLKRLAPDIPMTIFPFDHKSPDLSVVKEKENVFLFSCHSIEQVTTIPESYFEEISAPFNSVIGLHLEPFGFQLTRGSGDDGPVSKSHREMAITRNWNQNMAPVLLGAERKGVIKLVSLGKNVVAGQLRNPTSMAIWSRGIDRVSANKP